MNPGTLFTLLVLITTALTKPTTASYILVDNYTGDNFFRNFDFFTEPDPTGGFVKYVSESEAWQSGLIHTNNSQAYIGVDAKNVVTTGRPAIRITSKKTYNKGLLLADITHMPGGTCGVWPALWLLGNGIWPQHGEIDIVEGVNKQDGNLMTLHTTAGCVVDNQTTVLEGDDDTVTFRNESYIGTLRTANCDVDAPGQAKNEGCQIAAPAVLKDAPSSRDAGTFGARFNAQGGGAWAVEWTSASIKIWLLPRTTTTTTTTTMTTPQQQQHNARGRGRPAGVTDPLHPDPSRDFGEPLARFAGAGCDVDARFADMRVVLNTALCGAWAGAAEVWRSGGCAVETGCRTCRDYVAENPTAFAEAYWSVESLRWYEKASWS